MRLKTNKLPQDGINRILLRGTNWIGDAVMTLPAVASVRAAYPAAHLTVLAKPLVADIYRLFSPADEIVTYEKRYDNPWGVFRLAWQLRKKKFNAAILLQNAIEAAIMTRAAGIPLRAGYDSDGRGMLLTHAIGRTRDILQVHQIDYYLEMVKALGCPPVDRSLHLETRLSPPDVRDAMKQYLGDDRPIIGIAPGATYGPAKRWLPERFAQTADRLAEKLSARVVLFGGPDDYQTAQDVRRQGKSDFLNLAGKTSLRDAIYLISRSAVFVSNDSGLMHLAGALNVPTVAIFGSTNPVTTSPAGEKTIIVRKPADCSPCLKKVCPTDFRCMTDISVEDALSAATDLLRRESNP
ncbi:MAG: lipopolysaccharide heptosyltransferase II [Smithellaceae bacterium]